MTNIDNLPIETGNYVNSEEKVENLVDILRDGDQSSALFPDKHNTLNTQPAKSGNMVGSDGNVYNMVDLVKEVSSNSIKSKGENTQSIEGTLELATPDGTNVDAAVNVNYVNSVVGTIETELETV